MWDPRAPSLCCQSRGYPLHDTVGRLQQPDYSCTPPLHSAALTQLAQNCGGTLNPTEMIAADKDCVRQAQGWHLALGEEPRMNQSQMPMRSSLTAFRVHRSIPVGTVRFDEGIGAAAQLPGRLRAVGLLVLGGPDKRAFLQLPHVPRAVVCDPRPHALRVQGGGGHVPWHRLPRRTLEQAFRRPLGVDHSLGSQ